jgi:hypothetical protein
VTTNLGLGQLAAKWPAPFGEAIASRLAGYCKVVARSAVDLTDRCRLGATATAGAVDVQGTRELVREARGMTALLNAVEARHAA